ncbi:MAG TPA: glycosyltransferase family 9 protein [Candidatus Omnitrophota bacterium]|nr:glycosyltransferase family 9 protein [Candidatus Omnitrophota bacterium]
MKKKVLIIKLGYSETLDQMLSLTTSLGDVLRTTVILHFYKDCSVDWLVDEVASPLLEGNKYINRIYHYSAETLSGLRAIKYDIVINFEKLPDICDFAHSLNAREFFGFVYNGFGYEVKTHVQAARRLVELSQDIGKKRSNRDCWQKILSEAIGHMWNGEEYILGYRPRSKIKYDIGLNWATSSKWKNKTWPKSRWRELERFLKGRYSMSWQEGLDSVYDYIDWIHSCRMLVTCDSLGLHLALALRKRVVSLFGPTSTHEVYLYGRGCYVLPGAQFSCIPCMLPKCNRKKNCMAYINPLNVSERIDEEFARLKPTAKV